MAESASSLLVPWSSFFIMTGSAAAGLTGLMFVVISLVMGMERSKPQSDGIGTFSTPTVLHFGAALLVSAVLCAPWHSIGHPGIAIGLTGLAGIVYIVRIMARTRRLTGYVADREDWVWYTLLPLAAYGSLVAGAAALFSDPAKGLFALAGGALLLIFIGIRNAWDIVTFLATGGGQT
jgi:hypothetical protein